MLSLNKNNDKISQTQTNEFVSADDIKYENKEENIVENIVMEESVEVSNNHDIEEVDSTESKIEKQDVSNKNNEKKDNTTNKVITKETTTQKEATTTEKNTNSTSKSEEKKEPNIIEKPKEDIAKDNEESSTDKQSINNTKTEEIIENPKCNHSNENYYNTEEEAIAFYKKTSKEYGDKVKNKEITYEEYLKKCPYGYETMSCPYCQKWTISFYYE